jgi:phage gp36-like protein
MPYATESDLRVSWSDELVNLLAWDNASGAVNETRIAAALANAASTIDAYLARRYALPVNPRPGTAALLSNLNGALAVAQLAISPGTRSDIVVDAEKRALAFLRDVSEGKAALDLILPPSAGEPISPGEAVMVVQSGDEAGDRDFSRSRLRGL